MTEHPIIFSTEMVKAILDGKKTMTRRVIKPQPKIVHALYPDATIETEQLFKNTERLKCPYGQIGDSLWVRETWNYLPNEAIENPDAPNPKVWYLADFNTRHNFAYPWKPSIFMPRWASRITLEITNIKVERLQEITEEDAKAEGFEAEKPKIWWQGYREWDLRDGRTDLLHQQSFGDKPPDWMIEPHRMQDRPDLLTTAKSWFISYWEHLNFKRGYSWESNPWVWVIEFKKTE